MIKREDYERVEKPNTRGKVLGGSSCLNYYTWVPGSKATFDDWVPFAGSTWDWESCKEYFYKPSTYHDDDKLYRTELNGVSRGGPIPISHAELIPEMEPFRQALQKAWDSKGLPSTDNVHFGEMHGMWKCLSSIYRGFRSSSWMYLVGKKNVTVLSEAHSKRLLFDGTTATGVEVFGPGGSVLTFKAKREIIVSSGVYETPKLLMLSGVGPEAELKAHGIDVVIASPHVGQNLLDHPIMPHVFKLKDGYGLDDHLLRAGPEHDGAISAYRKNKNGPLGSGLLEMVGFPRIDEYLSTNQQYVDFKAKNGGVDPFGPGGQPHFEVDFVPMFCDAFQWHIPTPPQGSYFTVIVDLLRPISKPGEVKLNSTDPLEQPFINLNFFADDLDLIAMTEGVRFIDDMLLTGDGMKDIIVEDYPWAMPRRSDEAMRKMILERSQTGFHPCGTCRLSKDIKQGVVDAELKVHGAKNLRVIDASVFPVCVSPLTCDLTVSNKSRSSQIAVSRTPSIWLLRRAQISSSRSTQTCTPLWPCDCSGQSLL
jgi:choline dehydrogenase